MLLSRWLNAFTSRLSVSGKKNRGAQRRSAGRGTSANAGSASWIVSPNGSGQSAGFGGVVEALEDRALLDASGVLQQTLDAFHGPDHVGKDGPMAGLGFNLTNLYFEYQDFLGSGTGAFQSNNSYLNVVGDSVVIDARADGDVAGLRGSLEAIGLQVTGTYGPMISGLLPINSIPNAAGLGSLGSLGAAAALSSVGAVNSQGDAAQTSDDARTNFSVNGAGITVGVLSDSYNTGGFVIDAPADVASGDLPGVGNPNGFFTPVNVLDDSSAGGSDEGRGMLQIVHDVAPGAALSFHTAFTGQANFAQGILDLAAAGADVIVDDVFYFAEPFFQDGVIAQAVDTVYAAGVTYFSSAGNQARQSYESAFVSSGVSGGTNGFVDLHDFGGGDAFQQITIPAFSTVTLIFQWDEAFGNSTNDVDIYLLDAANTSANVLASSFDFNIGGDPFEFFTYTAGAAPEVVHLAIDLFDDGGSPTPGLMKYVYLESDVSIDEFATNSGASFGHSNAAGAIAVGAAFYGQTPEFGQTPPLLESFSSAGGKPILFDTAGVRLGVPEFRNKPEITAPDGGNTTFFGSDIGFDADAFPNFFGTSAAAPHAAGGAALMLQANPGLSPTDILNALQDTAINIGPAGYDLDSGYGLIDINAAIALNNGPITTMFAGGVLTFTGGGLDDLVVIRSTGVIDTVEYDNGAGLGFLTLAGVNQVIFNAGGGDDHFVVFNTNGDLFAPTFGIIYNAGTTAEVSGDTLTIGGGGAGITAEYTPSDADSGLLAYTLGFDTESITFNDLEALNDEKTADSLRVNGSNNPDTINIVTDLFLSDVVIIDQGGPVLIDGGDRDEHGFFSGGNQNGWKFIEQSLVFLDNETFNPAPMGGFVADIAVMGTFDGSAGVADDAIISAAFAAGLSVAFIDSVGSIEAVNFANYRIIYVPTDEFNTTGGISNAEIGSAVSGLGSRKADIVDFIRSGGGLMALTEEGATNPYVFLELPLPFTIAATTNNTLRQTQDLVDAGFVITDGELTNGTPVHNTFTGPAGFNGLDIFVMNLGTNGINESFGMDGVPSSFIARGGDDQIINLGRGATFQTVGGNATETVTFNGVFLPITFAAKTALTVNWLGGNDSYLFAQAMLTGTGTPQNLIGGDGLNDVLTIDAQGQTVNDTGTEFQFTGGYNAIKYSGWETINIINAAVAPLDIDGTAGDDNITVSFTATTVGVSYGGVTYNYQRPTTTGVTVNGGAGSDRLIVDLTGNDVLPAGFLTFHGGESVGDHDVLEVTGYDLSTGLADGIADVIVNHTGAEDGNVIFTSLGTIFFTQTEPVILAGSAADMVLNFPAGPTIDAVLGNDTFANFGVNGTNIAGRSAIDASTFEYTEFVNPTNSLLINLQNNGDTIEVRTMDAAFNPATGTIIQGGNGNDTFINTDNNAGTIMRFLGGAGDDTFTINATLTGQIDGQADNFGVGLSRGDTLNGNQIDNLTLLGSDTNGFNGTEANITGDFDGIDSFDGNNGTITGINVASIWNVNGATVDYTDTVFNNTAVISGFNTLFGGTASDQFTVTAASSFNLTGGAFVNSGDDTFTIDAPLTGSVAGQNGNDILQGTQITNVTLTAYVDVAPVIGFSGSEADITGGFSGIDDLRGAGNATLTNNLGVSATWNLGTSQTFVEDMFGGTLSIQGFTTLNAGNQGDTFNVTASTFATLNGGTGADTFDITLGSTLTGEINGNTGTDTLQGSAIDAVTLTTSNATGWSGNEPSITNNPGFEGIDNIVGSNLAGSTLTGRDFASVWTLDGANPQHNYNDGLFNLPFSGFQNLQGGTSGDTFNLESSSAFDSVLGGLGGDTFNFNNGATFTGAIDGQGGMDLLQGANIDNVTLTGSTGDREFNGTENNIVGSFAGIGNIVGNGNATLTGEDTGALWSLNGTATYSSVNNLDFSQFSTLQGGDGADGFVVSAASSINLHGGAGADIFVLNAPLTGGATLNGGAGTDQLSGSVVDSVTLTGAGGIGEGLSGNAGASAVGFLGIDQLFGTGTGTLTGSNNPGTWNLDPVGVGLQYTSGGETLQLGGFPTLQGGTGIDTFNVVSATVQTLRGGDSDDIFNLSATLTGDIFGEAGANDVVNFLTNGFVNGNIDLGTSGTLDYSAQTNDVRMTVVASGTSDGFQLDDDNNTFFSGTANNITTIIGSANAGALDILTGLSIVSTWNLNGNGVAAHNYSTATRNMNFSGFEGVQGGSDNDTFNVNAATSGTFLNGGNGNDTFNINATLTDLNGNIPIFAQGGVDTLQGTLIDSVVLTNSDNGGFDGNEDSLINTAGQSFDDIEVIIGNGSATSSLTGENNAATWALNNAPSYTVGGVNFLSVTGFTNLQGGSAVDTFNVTVVSTFNLLGGDAVDVVNFLGAGQIIGTVDGGLNGATLDMNLSTNGFADSTLTDLGSITGFRGTMVRGVDAQITGEFNNITTFIASQSPASDFLFSDLTTDATWTVAAVGTNQTYVTGGRTLNFSGWEQLNGGTGNDTFIVTATTTEGLLGRGGNDILTGLVIDAVTLTGSGIEGYSGTESDIGGFNDIDVITGTGAVGSTLTGEDTNSTWTLGTVLTYNDGAGNGSVAFSGFANLQGGTQIDTFNVSESVTVNVLGGDSVDVVNFLGDGQIVGNVDGGLNGVTLDMSQQTLNTFTDTELTGLGTLIGFAGQQDGTTQITGTYDNVTTFIGGSDPDADFLTGLDGVNATWTLGVVQTYVSGGRTLVFAGWEDLFGGTGNDTFIVNSPATTLTVRGQGGNDTLQGTQINAVSLTGSDADGYSGNEDSLDPDETGFSGINAIVGNGAGTFAGSTIPTFNGTWTLNGTATYDDGQGNPTIGVSGFTNLQAGDLGDTFNVTGNTTANILGGASADTINVQATLTGNILAGGGNDIGNFITAQALVTGNIDGGTSMTLDFADYGAPVTVNLNNSGTIDGFGGTATGVGSFDNITTLIGSAAGDTLNGDDVTSTWNGLGSATQTYTTGAGVDQRTLQFSGFETLQGNSGEDTFNTTANNALRLRGGAGNDRFNHAADQTPNFIDGQTGTDTVDYSLDLVGNTYDLALGTTEGFSDIGFSDNIEVLNGGTGLDTLTGVVGADAVWTQAATQTYVAGGRTLTISLFDTWQGESGADTYAIQTTNAANITLAGGAGNDDFFLDVAFNGHIDGELGTDSLQLFNVLDATVSVNGVGSIVADNGLQGNSSQINGTSSEFDNINTFSAELGTGGTFTGGNTASTWTINGAVNSTYSDGVVTVGLTGFANLQGNGDVDNFNVIAASTFNLLGGAGADVFDVDAALTGSITGEGDSDTLRGDTIDDVQLLGADANGFIGTEGSITPVGFFGIDAIEGSNTVDSVLRSVNAPGLNASWTINGAASSYNAGPGLATLSILGNWDTLVGGRGIDAFLITGATDVDLVSDPVTALGTPPTFIAGQTEADQFLVGAVLTGNIFTGPGLDFVSVTPGGQVTGTVDLGNTGTIDLSAQVVSRTVNLTDVGTIDGFQGNVPGVIGSFNNMTTLIGGAANDTLVGVNFAATWDLTAANRFYRSTGSTLIQQSLLISSMETLQGGSGVDTYNLTAPHAGSLLGGDGNDIFNINSQVILSLAAGGVVDGQGGSDTLQGNVISAVVITNVDAGGFDGTETDIVGNFADVETINGNGIGASITGNNSSAIWNLDGSPQYITNGQTLNVSAFGTLVGGNVDDRFNVTAPGPSLFTLQGAAGNDIFDIDALLTGNVDGGADVNTLQGDLLINSVIQNLDGTGADGTALGAVTGGYVEIDNLFGSPSGTLIGLNAASTWNLALAPTYVVGTNSVGFSGFSTLQGGTLVDQFLATANNSPFNIVSGDGADLVSIAAGATLTGNVNTGADNDTIRFLDETGFIAGNVNGGSSAILDYSMLATPVSVTLNAVGSNDGFSGLANGASQITGTFDNITTILGGSGTDMLTGQNASATWQLDGVGIFQGVYLSGGRNLSFSDLNSLVGNAGSDLFSVTADPAATLNGGAGADTFDIDVALSGVLTGGAGIDILQGDVINAVTLIALNNVAGVGSADGTEADINGGVNSFTSIESINGNMGSITGIIGVAAVWALDGTPTFALAATPLVTLSVATFSNLQGNTGVDTYNVTVASAFNLLGGGGDDVFDIDAALTGTVDGQGGTFDALMGSTIDAVILTLVDANGADGTETSISGNFTDIETITGNGAGTTLTGVNAASLWNLDGSAQYSMDAGATFVNFGGFANLVGLGLVDTFNVNGPGPSAFNLAGGNAADIFNINAALSGNIAADVGDDVINMNNGGSVSGNVDGGNTAHLNFGANAGPITVTLTDIGTIDGFRGTATGISGTFDNITTLTGSLGADTLNGDDQVSVWNLAAAQTYVSQSQTLNFSGFETLTGNTAVDTFNVTANTNANLNGGAGNDRFTVAAVTLTGAINAGTGTDTLDGAGINAVVLTNLDGNGADGTEPSINAGVGVTSFTDVEQIDGTAAAGSLTGVAAATATWGLDGTPTYTIGANSVGFTGFLNLNGSSGVDTFTVTAASQYNLFGSTGNDIFTISAVLTGSVNGDGGTDTLQGTLINGVALTNVDVNGFDGAEPDITGGFNDIETINGNLGSLTGLGIESTWTLTGGTAGTYVTTAVANTLTFSGFAFLLGNNTVAVQDTFNVNAAATMILDGGLGNDIFNINAILTGSLSGNTGSDTLAGTLIDNATITNLDVNGADGTEASITADFNNIETLTGTNVAATTLTGQAAVDSIWNLDGTPTYQDADGSLNFTGFRNLQGGGAIDTFNVTAASTFNLFGGAGADDVNIAAALTGTVSTEAGDDTIDFSLAGTVSGNVDGGTSAALTLNGLTVPANVVVTAGGTIDGVRGTIAGVILGASTFDNITTLTGHAGGDSITGANGTWTWNLAATQTYTNGARTVLISNFDTLQGGTGSDTFNVTVAPVAVTRLNGGSGTDLFDIDIAIPLTSINGESGSDTLQGDVVNIVTLTGSDVDGFDGNEADINAGLTSFDGIDILTATGAGTLNGQNANATWRLDGTPTYEVGAFILGIAGFLNLNGGTASDTYLVTALSTFNLDGGAGTDSFDIDATLTGTVNGGVGSDTLLGNLIDNLTITNVDANGADGTEASITGNFTDVESIIGNGGTLTGQAAVISTWTINGNNSSYADADGTVAIQGFANYQGGGVMDTFNITGATTANLLGGAGTDLFDVGATLTGSINGQANADTVQGSLINDVLLTFADVNGFDMTEASVTGGINDIETLTGNNTTGSRLTGIFTTSTWTLDGTPTYTALGQTLNFSNFADLQGNASFDTFDVTGPGPSSFNLFGGSSADVFNISAALTSSLIAAGNISAEGGDDDINMNAGASVAGNVDGGTSAELDYTNFVGPITVVFTAGGTIDGFQGTATGIGGTFNNIDTLRGSAAADSLTGLNAGGTFELNALNNASLTDTYTSGTRTILFSGFFGADTLQGGTGADRFNVNVATSGNLLGGAGSDVFNLNAALTGRVDGQGTDNFVSLDVLQGSVIDAVILTNSDGFGFDGTETSITAGFTDIETVTGNGLAGSTLTGQGIDINMEAIDSVWLLDGSPTYTAGNVYFLNFSSFANLVGGAAVDEFRVTAPSTFIVNGGAGDDFFTINSTLTGSVTGGLGNDEVRGTQIDVAVLTNSDANGFDGTEANITAGFNDIETLTGNGNVGTSLTGQNAVSTWALDGTPTYTAAAGALNFNGFADIHGGTAVDTFNITGDTTINIFGGNSADIVNISAHLTGNISTEAGLDDINFLPLGQVTGNIDGGTSAFLDYSGYGSAVAVQLNGPGSIDGYTGTSTALNGTFDNITTLIGSAAADVLTGDDINGIWNLAGAANQTYLTGTGSGARTLLFSAIETLQGNSAVDTFNVTAATTEILNGGNGDDVFNINAVLTGSTNGEAGSDTLRGTLINLVTITLLDADGADGTEADVTAGFTDIETLTGTGAVGTTFNGQAAVTSTWNLDGTPTYEDADGSVSFSGFLNLQGGAFEDTFNVLDDSTFTSIRAGLGNDVFNIDATLTGLIDGEGQSDTLAGTRINGVVLTGSDADGFAGTEDDITAGFDGIDTIIGSGGTLQGENVASTWTLDGSPTYFDGANTLDFSGFDNLQGGSAADTFLVTADSTFNLLGGDGADLFDIDAVLNGSIRGEGLAGSDVDTLQGDLINDVFLFGHDADGFFGFEADVTGAFFSIDSIIGNDAPLSRIIGMSLASTWALPVTTPKTATYTQAGQTLDIENFAILQGGEATDTFTVTGLSEFELRGGNGNDIFTFAGAELIGSADGEGGNDLLNGTGATAGLTLRGSRGNDTIIGSALNDSLDGGTENDSISGAAGNDTITGGTGNDTLDGGAGFFDKLLEFPIGNVVLTNTALNGVGVDKLSFIEEAEFIGNDANNFFDASKFTLGRVTLRGGAGDDTLYGTPLSDIYDGGAGFDTVKAVSLSNIFATNTTIVNSTSADSLTSIEALDLTGHFTTGTTINASAFTGPTTLTGGAGADRLTSGQGNSVLKGNAGNDILVGGKGWDLLSGGNDNDSLDGGLGNDTLNGEVGNDTLKGGVGDDKLYGGAGRDKIYGGVGQDLLDGGADNDTLAGEDGHDTMFGGAGSDVMAGGTGHDTMDAGDGNDTMDGGDGDDSMAGGTGNDTILGQSGSDRINGGSGIDKINGGSGSNLISDSISEINEIFSLDINKLLI